MSQAGIAVGNSLKLHDHLIARIKADIEFLAAADLCDEGSKLGMLGILDNVARSNFNRLTAPGRVTKIDNLAHVTAATTSLQLADHISPPPPPSMNNGQDTAIALWNYSASQPDDLAFSKGDTIVIASRDNDHWWRGSVMHDPSGRVGLFPSNHVEVQNKAPPAPAYHAPPGSYYSNNPEKAALAPYQAPPPPQHASASYYQQPPPPQPYYQNAQTVSPAEHEKKSKFKIPGKGTGLGNTLAHAGVGGLGFGAGSALAGNLVNAIL